jgi:hypothetical protein
VTTNFGDFQNEVYAEAVQGVTTRYPFDFASIERKASEALPDWVYRYVSAAAGDGRTQRAKIAALSCYGIVPRMMVSPTDLLPALPTRRQGTGGELDQPSRNQRLASASSKLTAQPSGSRIRH